MLLWEALALRSEGAQAKPPAGAEGVRSTRRLPFEKRCAAITRSGRRCRGKIRPGSDFCPFHDPTVSAEQRRANAAKGGRSRHRLAHLPDGYLRRLSSPAAVGSAMDRLYREVRLGIVDPPTGRALLDILTRILKTQFDDPAAGTTRSSGRRKADRIGPKLRELLTRAERAAWREAAARSPSAQADDHSARQRIAPADARDTRETRPEPEPSPAPLVFTHAS